MGKKASVVLICLILCLLNILTGCGRTESDKPDPDAISKISEKIKNIENDKDKAADIPDVTKTEETKETVETVEDEDTDDGWKAAYIKVLNELRADSSIDNEDLVLENLPYQYIVYDIDKDGIPELLVEFGICEADYNGKLYKYENGAAVEKEPFSMGHTSLYSVPDENGILFNWGHMGSAFIQKATMDETGRLAYTELLSEELDPNTDDYYTNPSELVPGACYLSMCDIKYDIYINSYEKITAQISKSPEPLAKSDIIPNNIEEIVPDILENNGKVFAVSADGYGGDLGPDTEMEYLLANVDQWSGHPYQVEDTAYVDVNNDKQLEAVLKLLETGTDSPTVKWLVMVATDDTVYAYVINYMDNYKLVENGTFIPTEEFYNPERIEFDRDECLLYIVDTKEEYKEVI